MTYDVMSNPLRKNQTISGSTVATSHDLTYLYEGEKPDAASQIGEDRYTYDDNGNVSQFVCYTPYGEAIVDEHLTTYENPFKFSGKELDDITGLYDHGARSRNPVSTLWYGVDPLWEKYPDFSPYNYCAGNPVKLVDEDGRKLRFADGVSNEFKQNFAKAVKYLREHGCGDILTKLENLEGTVYITETTSFEDKTGSRYSRSKNTIYWNPKEGLVTDNGNQMSPAAVLNHEADHALEGNLNPEQQRKNSKYGTDKQYDSKEERRVITGSEQETARKTGELKKNTNCTRSNHRTKALLITKSPTSNTGTIVEPYDYLQVVEIKAKKNNYFV